MAATTIILRLTISDPVEGLAYSLQDKANHPVDSQIATSAPLGFDIPVSLSPEGRLSGVFVRREGPLRRFVYIALGTSAGQASSELSRRAKIDIHDISPELVDEARKGRVLEAVLPSRGKDGTPACATVRPLQTWRLA